MSETTGSSSFDIGLSLTGVVSQEVVEMPYVVGLREPPFPYGQFSGVCGS